MFVTHSYLGATSGDFKCLFFLLLEDYIDEQTQFMIELDKHLERFARNLKGAAPLWRPFTGDIEQTKRDVLRKNWTHAQLNEIEKTPGLLMINMDFKEFDPQIHPWFHFHFGQRLCDSLPSAEKLAGPLKELADAICHSDEDIFRTAYKIFNEKTRPGLHTVFQAKPGVFGFSVDLVKGSELLQYWRRALRGETHP